MAINNITALLSKAIAGIAAIPAIASLVQLIAQIGNGGAIFFSMGRVSILSLSPILIWFFAPKIVNKLYKSNNEITTETFKSVLMLTVGVAFGLIVFVEVISLMAEWYSLQRRVITYGYTLLIRAASIVPLICISIYLIKKSKTI